MRTSNPCDMYLSPVYLEAAEGLVIAERSHRDQRLARVGPTERPLAVRLAGWQNFERVYRPLVDAWAVYDNSGPEPKLVDWGEQTSIQSRLIRQRIPT